MHSIERDAFTVGGVSTTRIEVEFTNTRGGIETVYAFLVNAFDTGGVSVDEYDACHPLFEESPCPGVLKTTELNPGASIRGYVYFVESPYYPLEFIQFSEPHTFERTDKIAVPVPSRPAPPTPVPLDSPALGDVVASGHVDAVVHSIERDAFTVGGVSTTRIEVEFTNTRGGIETVYAFLVNAFDTGGVSVDEYDACHPLFEESPCPGVLKTTELNPGASIRGYVYFVESPYYPLEFIQFSEPHILRTYRQDCRPRAEPSSPADARGAGFSCAR